MTDARSSKRLPRQHRVPEEQRPSMRLTDRDCEVIKLVNDCRALREDQIRRVYFGSRSTAQYRLARLYHHEFLDRQFLSTSSSAPASNPAIYTLGLRGEQVLVDRFNYDRSDFRRPSKGKLSWHLLEHLLKVNDVRITVMTSASQAGCSLDSWLDETYFRAKPDHAIVFDTRGRKRKYPLFPDGFFSLTTPKGKANFFLEVDRGTESLAKFMPQVIAYEWYIERGQYQAKFVTRSLRILVVTSSRKRMENLMHATKRCGGDRKYCFTTFDEANGVAFFTKEIWERLEQSKKEALVEPIRE